MTITAVTGNAQSSTRSASQSLAGNFDNFLKLLTTQLQRQDPLAPMDATAFTSQLVEFASVEQAIQTNTRLSELKELTRTSVTSSALGLLGRDVTAATDKVALPSEGDAVIRYRLPEAAAEVRVSVLDGNGRVVHTAVGPRSAGDNAFAWNGLGADGQRLPSGDYTVRVEAKAADEATLAAEQFVRGKVQGLEPTESGLNFVVDGITVPLGTVRNVGEAA
jgi:flagellar basal-body rod modification protein FlgD